MEKRRTPEKKTTKRRQGGGDKEEGPSKSIVRSPSSGTWTVGEPFTTSKHTEENATTYSSVISGPNRTVRTCTSCFQYTGTNLRKHTCTVLKRRLTKADYNDMVQLNRQHVDSLSNHLYLNPDSANFPKAPLIPYDVFCSFLSSIGHHFVPKAFRPFFSDSLPPLPAIPSLEALSGRSQVTPVSTPSALPVSPIPHHTPVPIIDAGHNPSSSSTGPSTPSALDLTVRASPCVLDLTIRASTSAQDDAHPTRSEGRRRSDSEGRKIIPHLNTTDTTVKSKKGKGQKVGEGKKAIPIRQPIKPVIRKEKGWLTDDESSDPEPKVSKPPQKTRPQRSTCTPNYYTSDDGECDGNLDLEESEESYKPQDTESTSDDETVEPVRRELGKSPLKRTSSVVSRIKKKAVKKLRFTKSPGKNKAKGTRLRPVYKQDSVREKLQAGGLYDYRLCQDFLQLGVFTEYKTYLSDVRYKSEDTVAYYLPYVQMFIWHTTGCTADSFCFDLSKVTVSSVSDFIGHYKSFGVQAQTVSNLLKVINRFLEWCATWKTTDATERDRLTNIRTAVQNMNAGQSIKAKRDYRRKKSTDPGLLQPITPDEASSSVRQGLERAKQLCSMVEAGNELDSLQIVFLTRFITAYICLCQTQRPGICKSLLLDEVLAGRTAEIEGSVYHIVFCAEHKTADFYFGQIAFTEDYWKVMMSYIKLRAQVMAKHQQSHQYFFICFDGKRYTKVSKGIHDYQQSLGIETAKIYTATQARHAIETFTSGLTEEQKTAVSTYIAHSQAMAKKRYVALQPKRVAQASHIVETVRGLSAQDPDNLPTELPLSSKQTCNSTPGPKTSTPAKKSSDPLASSTPVFTSPTTLRLKTLQTLQDELTPMGSTTSLPGVEDIRQRFPEARAHANYIRETLRRQLRVAIGNELADDVIFRRARHLKTGIERLDFEQVRSHCPTQNVLNTKLTYRIQQSTFMSILQKRLEYHQQQAHHKIQLHDEDRLSEYVNSQQWPNLIVRPAGDAGNGVFVKDRYVEKGSVLMDYHGNRVSKKEGEKIAAGLPSEKSNYMFYINQDCIDACSIPCKCHPTIPSTFGRMTNHCPGEQANMRPIRRDIGGQLHVFLVATRDISPLEELRWDYGVRRSEDGSKLEWLSTV